MMHDNSSERCQEKDLTSFVMGGGVLRVLGSTTLPFG